MSMKKMLCALVALTFYLSSISFASSEGILNSFDLVLTKVFDLNVKEWMENEYYRALLTVGLAYDVGQVEELPYTPDLSESSYIGRSGFGIAVCTETNTENVMLVLIYYPHTKEAEYFYAEDIDEFDVVAKGVMSETCQNGYYKNDPVVLYEVAEILMDAIGN